MGHWSDGLLFHNIAHRGASAYAPDNSIEAFELARQHSATDVEVDLHCTSDGEFVIRHDAIVNDQAPKFISELSYGEYRSICDRQSQPCVDLDQLIEVAKKNNLGIYLDVKQVLPGRLPGLLGVIRAAGYQQKVVIASFRTDIVREVKEIDPGFLTSVLFHDPNLDPHSLVQAVKCDFLHPCFDIFGDPLKYFTSQRVDRFKSTGAGLIAWNVTTPEVADVIVAMDIDGACADDPQVLEDALLR